MIEFEELRALIVYDNHNMGQLIATVLRPLGVRKFGFVDNAHGALEIIEATHPDVVIQDIRIGGTDGLDLVRAVRDRATSFNPYLPVVIASGHDQPDYVKAAINAGAHEYVTMPLHADAFAQRLYSAVFMGRPFVETADYFGPDRRRGADPDYEGPERRAAAAATTEALARRSAEEARFAERLREAG